MRQGGDPTLRVCCRHMPEDVVAVVEAWYAGQIEKFDLSGDRSVYIPHPEGDYTHIKIKGAGMRGGAIDFGRYLNAGPDAPLFDFDGRRMLDVAFGHDGAFVGGASLQQSATEWRMSQHLPSLGYSVVPCLGYGSVFDGVRYSWFTVYRWNDGWLDTPKPPHGTAEVYEYLTRQSSKDALDLAINHNLAGFFWRVRAEGGVELLKDLHPFRRLDPVNQSQISWVMQVYHALHITAINTRILSSLWFGEAVGTHAGLWMITPFLPEATLADWDDLRMRVVLHYMMRDPVDFRPETLASLLEGNPITAKLMELCPQEYARFR